MKDNKNNASTKTGLLTHDFDEKAYHSLQEEIENFHFTVTSKKAIKPATILRHQELLSYVDQLQSTYTPALLTEFSIDEQKQFMIALKGAIKYIKADDMGMTVEMLDQRVKSAINTATDEILAQRLANSKPVATRPTIKRSDDQKNELKQTSTLSESELSAKINTLKTNIDTLNYDRLKEDQSYGGFLQDKLSSAEFDQIKEIVTELNIDKIKQGISDKGFFSIKKAEVGKVSDVEQGEHSMVMEGLPRSVVITERDGKLEFTILTKSKTADSTTKDQSAKFRGGNSTASRALRFTTSEQGGLEMDTVIIKTSKTKSVTDKWYQEASTDPLDKPTRAPNGMFVEDGGNTPIQLTRSDKKLNEELSEKKDANRKKPLEAANELEIYHGDLKPANILVNSKQEIRIIDMPLDYDKARANIYDSIHFKEGFKAQTLAELAGKIQQPPGFCDTTMGQTSVHFTDGGDEILFQIEGELKNLSDLGVSKTAQEKISTALPLITGLHTAFHCFGGNLEPKFNDSWGLLNIIEEIYMCDQSELSQGDINFLAKIRTQQKLMVEDIADLTSSVPECIQDQLTTINTQINFNENALNQICKAVNDKDQDENIKRENITSALKASNKLLSDDLNAQIESLSSATSEAEFAKTTQDAMQSIITERDHLGAQLDSIISLPMLQDMTTKKLMKGGIL